MSKNEKLITEGMFLSSFMLRVLTPFFQNKYGKEPQLIMARRILEFEFDKTLDSNNYMRKEDGLSAILYGLIYAQFKELGHRYIMPPALPSSDQLRIKKIYGIVAEVKTFYTTCCNRSGDIELPRADSVVDTDFLYRIEDLCTLRDKFLIVTHNVLSAGQLFKFDNSTEINDFKITRKQYLEFDINKQYPLNKLFEDELQAQAKFLQEYTENVWKKPVQSDSKAADYFSEEIIKGLSNVFKLLLSRRVVNIKKELVLLVKWELLRLRLARVLDTEKFTNDKDFKQLICLLLAAKPNSLKAINMAISVSKTFPLKAQTVLAAFMEVKSLPKSCGNIYIDAQLNIALAERAKRQQDQTQNILQEFKEELKTAESEKQIEILKAIQAIELGISRLADTGLKQEFNFAIQEKAEIACELFELDNEVLKMRHKGKALPIPPGLILQKKLLTSHLRLVTQKAADLQSKLEEKKQSAPSHSSSSSSSSSFSNGMSSSASSLHSPVLLQSKSSMALMPARHVNGAGNGKTKSPVNYQSQFTHPK